MEKINVAIIGSGFIAEHHCHAYNLLPNVDIIGISSLEEQKAKELMNKYNLSGKIVKNYEDLLKLDCEAISVCIPNFLHKKVTIDVLNSGKHALVEKPLAKSISEGVDMLEAEKTSNRKIFYCENNMYAPSF
ncbi:MAG: Gfo/Idh/MocA family protein, partial [Promethearchaeota archaeon]